MSKIQTIKSILVPQMRAAGLGCYVSIAGKLGVDPYILLRRAKIHPGELADPETRLAAGAVVTLLEETAQISGNFILGLLLAEASPVAGLGPISLLLQHQPNVRETIASMVRHQRMFSDIAYLNIDDDGEMALFRLEVSPGFSARQMIENMIATMYRVLNDATGGRWQPDCIHFRHAAPANLQAHRRVFHCPVEFDSDFDGISLSSASLGIANPLGDETMARHAERCMELLTGQRPARSITERVRHAISSLLGCCTVTIERVADRLGLHPRILQRQLENEETTFSRLLNETRRDFALRYLANANNNMTDVALLVGYSTLSCFTRWFTIEFGKPPAAWRNAEHRGGLSSGHAARIAA